MQGSLISRNIWILSLVSLFTESAPQHDDVWAVLAREKHAAFRVFGDADEVLLELGEGQGLQVLHVRAVPVQSHESLLLPSLVRADCCLVVSDDDDELLAYRQREREDLRLVDWVRECYAARSCTRWS